MKRIIFGHIVNHREPKGTKYVLEAMHNVRMKGLDFGFVFVERLPHDAAVQLYTYIDVLLEQFVIGWYGSQAVEFMSMGKPVVVYINSDDIDLIPAKMAQELPIIPARKDNLEYVVIDIIKGVYDLESIGSKGIRFVNDWHHPKKIADRMIKDYQEVLIEKRRIETGY